MEVLPLMTDHDAPVAKAVAHSIMEIFDRQPDYIICLAPTIKHIARIGHIYDCIAYGQHSRSAHRPDEWSASPIWSGPKVMAIGLDVLPGAAARKAAFDRGQFGGRAYSPDVDGTRRNLPAGNHALSAGFEHV
jgi:succinyl-diaminopimelate desuccinylase